MIPTRAENYLFYPSSFWSSDFTFLARSSSSHLSHIYQFCISHSPTQIKFSAHDSFSSLIFLNTILSYSTPQPKRSSCISSSYIFLFLGIGQTCFRANKRISSLQPATSQAEQGNVLSLITKSQKVNFYRKSTKILMESGSMMGSGKGEKSVRKIFNGMMGAIIGEVSGAVTMIIIVVWINVFEMHGRSSKGGFRCINGND